MGHAAAVPDHIQPFIGCFQVLVNIHFHIVEFHLYAVEKRIVIGRPLGNLIQGIDHLDQAVQDSLRQDKAQVSGRSRQRGAHQSFLNPLPVASASPDQISETLYDHAASQHIGQPGDAFPVPVAVLEGLGKMFCHQKGEVGILRLLLRVLIAVPVDRHNPLGIFIDHDAVGIHAECPHIVLKFFRPVYDLALIQFIGQVGKNLRRKLHAHADVHPVGAGRDIQLLADLFHPFAAAPAYGNDTFIAVVGLLPAVHTVSLFQQFDMIHLMMETELHLIL